MLFAVDEDSLIKNETKKKIFNIETNHRMIN
jgi:hypothetical protein